MLISEDLNDLQRTVAPIPFVATDRGFGEDVLARGTFQHRGTTHLTDRASNRKVIAMLSEPLAGRHPAAAPPGGQWR
jgi:hypothetical protein